MLIINGGIPRSGTVLVGNLLRLMLERRNIPWSRYNPQERRHLPDFLKLAQASGIDGAVIVHTHLIDATVVEAITSRPDAVIFWSYRDPRDALTSLMKLHDLPLADGLHAMQIYHEAAKLAHASAKTVKIRYEELVIDLARHIELLAKRLHFELQQDEVEDLIHRTSAATHMDYVEQLQQNTLPGARTIQTKRRAMREDPKTLLNDRHIQSGQTGRWRTELTASAQTVANAELDRWIRMFGYAPQDSKIS